MDLFSDYFAVYFYLLTKCISKLCLYVIITIYVVYSTKICA